MTPSALVNNCDLGEEIRSIRGLSDRPRAPSASNRKGIKEVRDIFIYRETAFFEGGLSVSLQIVKSLLDRFPDAYYNLNVRSDAISGCGAVW